MRFMNSADTTLPLCSWRFINVPSTLMLLSWRLNYAHDDCFCATAGYPISTFIKDAIPPQAGGILHLQVWGRLLSPSLDRRRDIPTPALRLLLPKLSEPRPSRTPSKKSPLSLNSVENKMSFMKSLVHDWQVDNSHWNNDIIHLV